LVLDENSFHAKAAKDAKETQKRCEADRSWFSFALLAVFARAVAGLFT
jgi:hypothetical protein